MMNRKELSLVNGLINKGYSVLVMPPLRKPLGTAKVKVTRRRQWQRRSRCHGTDPQEMDAGRGLHRPTVPASRQDRWPDAGGTRIPPHPQVQEHYGEGRQPLLPRPRRQFLGPPASGAV